MSETSLPARTDLFDRLDVLDAIQRLFDEHGDVAPIDLVDHAGSAYLIRHPEDVAYVLVRNHRNYVKGVGMNRVALLLGRGLFTSEGDAWKKQRVLLQPSFRSHSIESLFGLAKRRFDALVAAWSSDASASLDISADTASAVLDIVIAAVLGRRGTELVANYADPFAPLRADRARNLAFARDMRALRTQLAASFDAKHLDGADGILGAMAEAAHRQAVPIASEDLADQCVTLLVAGSETTAITLTLAIYLLCEHPDVQAKLRAEVQRGRADTAAALGGLPYLDCVLKETLRLYPPGWFFSRRAIAPDRLRQLDIAPGTQLIISPYFTHRHPQFWSTPMQFVPERFEADLPDARAFVPFSAGPRNCIGEALAWLMMRYYLSVALRSLSFCRRDNTPIELDPGINLRIKPGLRVAVTRI